MIRQKFRSLFRLTFQGLIVLVLIFFLTTNKIYSVECKSDSDLKNKTEEELKEVMSVCEKKLNVSREKINTLSSEMQFMDTRIYFTILKIKNTEQSIKKTEEEIDVLSSRIEGLDSSLDYLSNLLLERVIEGYKKRPLSMMMLLLDSNTASQFLTQFKYLRTTQKNNQKLLIQVQETKVNFEEQKKIREEKKKELDDLKITLDEQKKALDDQKLAKNRLLQVTKNNERTYQQLLSKAQAEYNAIRAIVAGSGTETKLREVRSGDVIASLIGGPSCNSSGSHLHFIVKENGQVSNPFNYLSSIEYQNCSGSSCGSGDGDSFNPSGSMNWPLRASIRMNQGYGRTWAVRNTWIGRIYNFHNGIDIVGSSNYVMAVSDGELYRGSFRGNKGCSLPYVKLVHKDSNIITYYLHVYVN